MQGDGWSHWIEYRTTKYNFGSDLYEYFGQNKFRFRYFGFCQFWYSAETYLPKEAVSAKIDFVSDLYTPPLLEGSEALLLEFWSGSEERLSIFFGGLKGGELPSFHCLSTPLHDTKEASS